MKDYTIAPHVRWDDLSHEAQRVYARAVHARRVAFGMRKSMSFDDWRRRHHWHNSWVKYLEALAAVRYPSQISDCPPTKRTTHAAARYRDGKPTIRNIIK
jgi:hypothetical protein